VNSSKNDKALFRYLLMRSIDELITDEEIVQLNSLLTKFADLESYYVRCIQLHCSLGDVLSSNTADFVEEPVLSELFWEALAEEERTTPAIEVPKVEPPRELIQKVVKHPIERVETSKFQIYAAVMSAAAVLFLVLFAKFNPVNAPAVALLSDSVDVEWAAGTDVPAEGSYFGNGVFALVKGYAEVTFNSGATVIIEGPSKFEMESADKMILHSGRLYATVSKGATGFTVQSPYSTVIDLGTEFGVLVNFDGSTDVHMFKGKASLIPGRNGKKEESLELLAGQAKSVSVHGQTHDIKLAEKVFVRHIDSKEGMVWRGNPINLVDLASGGNGFNRAKREFVIDPKTAKESFSSHVDRNCTNEYKEIPWSSVIDGVFVPDGKMPQIVSSLGDKFQDCPPTNGIYYTEIIFDPLTVNEQLITINGIRYGAGYRPGLFMHANLGITFDLDAIRTRYSGVEMTQFKSKIGNCDNAPFGGNADVWILVDGEVRYRYLGLTKGQLEEISVNLLEGDRFLTLVTTDGRDKDNLPPSDLGRASNSDWCVFAEPVIVIE